MLSKLSMTVPSQTALQKTRRALLKLLGASAIARSAGLKTESAIAGEGGTSWTSPEDFYFAYPHSSGFVSDTDLLCAQQQQDKKSIRYYVWNFKKNETTFLFATAGQNMYGDYCEQNGKFYYVDNRVKIMSYDVKKKSGPTEVFRPTLANGIKLQGLISVNPLGSKLLWAATDYSEQEKNSFKTEIYELDLSNKKSTLVTGVDFAADHQHYCPADPMWIGFAHEGDIRRSLDRVWAVHRHPGESDKAERIWNELDTQGTPLNAGHERWAFHALGSLVVAYPGAGQTGLYFIDATTQKGRLISRSNHDWHCNISRDGRMAVVDTTPPERDRYEADGRQISDIELVSMIDGQRKFVARAHTKDHPWHPHPHISPSGRYVVYNDYAANGIGLPSCIRVTAI